MTTIRVVLAIVVALKWKIRQVDVNNAFLNGDLKEEIFMEQQHGFRSVQYPNHVCRLVKAIYGLKQPRAWFDKLRITLLSWGFVNTKSDSSLFFFKTDRLVLLVLVYVDDILVTGNNNEVVQRFTERLDKVFSLKDLGGLHYFLGLEIQRDASGMYLSQRRYVLELLSKSNMLSAKACSTPMSPCKQLSTSQGAPLENPTMYRSVLGGLQYLVNTRHDIAFSVNNLSQFLSKPTVDHWKAVKRLLRYLNEAML